MKNLVLKTCLLFIGLSTGTLFSQAVETKIPTDPNVKIGKLENGLTYYIQNNGKPEDKLELRLAINAGSILENDDQQGLAHFVEHMSFNGTKNFKKNELVDYLQGIGVKFGADLNAYTGFDETVYILPIPSDNPEILDKGFQILEDWAHNALMKEGDIDGERGVVMEEYRLGLGPDKRMMQDYLPKLMYGSQYANRLPIGKSDVIENADYETVRSYYRDWYRPDLMAVIAVGDLEVEVIEQKIKQYFSRLQKVENPRERPVFGVPNHEETFVSIASDKESPFSQVRVYYKDREDAKDIITTNDYRDQMVKTMFSIMINERLNELRNNPNPPFTFGNSSYGGTYARSKKAYQSFAMSGTGDQLKALRALLEENERVLQHGFSEGELERAKNNYLAQMDRQYKDRDKQESGRIINQYVSNFLSNTPIPGIEWRFEFVKNALPSIQVKEVNALINDFLHDDNRVIIFTGPEKEDLKQVTEEEIYALLEEVENTKLEPYQDTELRENLITAMPKAGSITGEEINEGLDYKTLTLSNGARVVYKATDFKNDEILFAAYSPGGTSLYSDDVYKSTVYANGGLSEAGIAGLSLNDLNKMMTGKIVSVRPNISSFSEGFSGSSTPQDLETLFQLVHLYFTDLNMDEDAYKSFIAKQKNFLGNMMANPSTYFQNELGKFRNGGNSRYIGFPTPEFMDEQDYSLAYQNYQERFANASDFIFYFTGNIDEVKLKEYASAYLASLPSTSEKEEFIVPEFREPNTQRKKIIHKGSDPKSMVNFVWNGEVEYDQDEKMALEALGEILTIKLVEQLREEEAGVYGVGARGSMGKIPYESYNFAISFPCGPENVDRLTAATLAEVAKIKKDGPTEKDLAKVKESYMLGHKESLKENRFWLAQFQAADRDGSPLEDILKYEYKVASLSIAQIQEAANKYLDENYLLGILMPEEQ
ncbi:insulinase family protein [soil metagenome]